MNCTVSLLKGGEVLDLLLYNLQNGYKNVIKGGGFREKFKKRAKKN
jgi:hypothetical protein